MSRGLGLFPSLVLFLVVCALAQPILVPFAFALFLALLLAAPVDVLQKRLRFPRILAVLVILVAAEVVLEWVVSGVAAQGSTFLERWEGTDSLPRGGVKGAVVPGSYKARFLKRLEDVKSLAGKLGLGRSEKGSEKGGEAEGSRREGPGGEEGKEPASRPAGKVGKKESEREPKGGIHLSLLSLEEARSWILQGLGEVFSLVVNLVLIAFFLIFLLLDLENLERRIALATGVELGREGSGLVGQVETRLRRYIATVTLINCGLGLVVWAALALMGLEFPLLWGVLAGLLNFIPFVGATLAGIPPVVMALVQFDGYGPALAVVLVYAALQTLEGYLITPTIVGRLTSINPLALLLGAIFWGWLWGPVGLVLATPIMVCFHEIGIHVEALRPLAILLARGDGTQLLPAPRRKGGWLRRRKEEKEEKEKAKEEGGKEKVNPSEGGA